MNLLNNVAFTVSLLSLIAMLAALTFALQNKQVQWWPPPQKASWQYYTFWTVFRTTVLAALTVAVLSWDRFLLPDSVRYGLGLPLFLVGMGIAFYGYFIDLGIKNTQGLKEGLRTGGMYRYSRNPQYTAGIVGFVGTALLVNSWQVALLCALFIALYGLLPFLEEPWLEANYGEAYKQYREQTPRFF